MMDLCCVLVECPYMIRLPWFILFGIYILMSFKDDLLLYSNTIALHDYIITLDDYLLLKIIISITLDRRDYYFTYYINYFKLLYLFF